MLVAVQIFVHGIVFPAGGQSAQGEITTTQTITSLPVHKLFECIGACRGRVAEAGAGPMISARMVSSAAIRKPKINMVVILFQPR